MKGLVGLPACAALLGMFISGHASCEAVQIFTDRAHPVQLAGLKTPIIYLDEVERLEAVLSEGLSLDPVNAEQQALSLLHSPQGQQLQRELLDAYAGLAQAWHLGITHVPAVVQAGYVVYGETNIARAVRKIESSKSGRTP